MQLTTCITLWKFDTFLILLCLKSISSKIHHRVSPSMDLLSFEKTAQSQKLFKEKMLNNSERKLKSFEAELQCYVENYHSNKNCLLDRANFFDDSEFGNFGFDSRGKRRTKFDAFLQHYSYDRENNVIDVIDQKNYHNKNSAEINRLRYEVNQRNCWFCKNSNDKFSENRILEYADDWQNRTKDKIALMKFVEFRLDENLSDWVTHVRYGSSFESIDKYNEDYENGEFYQARPQLARHTSKNHAPTGRIPQFRSQISNLPIHFENKLKMGKTKHDRIRNKMHHLIEDMYRCDQITTQTEFYDNRMARNHVERREIGDICDNVTEMKQKMVHVLDRARHHVHFKKFFRNWHIAFIYQLSRCQTIYEQKVTVDFYKCV